MKKELTKDRERVLSIVLFYHSLENMGNGIYRKHVTTSTSTPDKVLLDIRNHANTLPEIDRRAKAVQLRYKQMMAPESNARNTDITDARVYATKQMKQVSQITNWSVNKVFSAILQKFEAAIPPQN